MDDLLYIIIGIGWVIYSVYMARQKAARKQQTRTAPVDSPSQSSPLPIPRQGEGRKSLLDEILEEISEQDKPPFPARQAMPPAPATQLKPKLTMQQRMEAAGSQEFITDEINPTTSHRIKHIKAETTAFEFETSYKNQDLARSFSLREAVIFSEILNRKYF